MTVAKRAQDQMAALCARGHELLSRREYDLAGALFARVLKGLTPSRRRHASGRRVLYLTYLGMGSCLLETGRVRPAITCFRRAQRLFPQDWDAHFQLGCALQREQRFGRALEAFSAAIAKGGGPPAYHRAAQCQLELGRPDLAEELCRAALGQDPDFEPAHLTLAVIHLELGNFPAAVNSLERAIEISPHDPTNYLFLAEQYRSRRLQHRAIECLERGGGACPDSLEIIEALAHAYQEQGRSDQVLAQGRALLRLSPRNPAAYDLIAQAHFQQGEFAQAIEAIREIIRLNPCEPGNRFKLGVLHQHSGDLGAAMREFHRTLQFNPDQELAEMAREAIEGLDRYQIEQLLLLAAEDAVFRIKLARDPERTVRRHGFHLSEVALGLLRTMDFDLEPAADRMKPPVIH